MTIRTTVRPLFQFSGTVMEKFQPLRSTVRALFQFSDTVIEKFHPLRSTVRSLFQFSDTVINQIMYREAHVLRASTGNFLDTFTVER